MIASYFVDGREKMDIRWLRSFLRVAETGSITRAASRLNIAQTALSRQIRLLEEELGVQLLARHRRGVLLTEAGQLLRVRSQSIVAALEAARLEVSTAGGEPSGTIGLGLPTSMLYVLSADLVEMYARRHPKVFLRVHEALGHTVAALLRDGAIDAAILISPGPMQGVILEPLITEDVYLAGPPDCGLGVDHAVSVLELASVPMIMFGLENKVRIAAEHLLARHGLSLNPVVEVAGQSLALELIGRGLGYSIMPHCAVRAEIAAGRVAGAPIRGLSVAWTFGVNRARAGMPALMALKDLLHSLVSDRISRGIWGSESTARRALSHRPSAQQIRPPKAKARRSEKHES